MRIILLHIIRFIFLILMQIFVVNYFNFGNANYLISPVIYTSYLLMLPNTYSKYIVLITAFLLGITIDYFLNTYGIHASACLLLAYLRPSFTKQLQNQNKFDETTNITIYTIDKILYVKYITILSFIFFFWLFLLEEFTLKYIHIILIKTILSTIVSVILIIMGQLLLFKKPKI